MVRRILFHAPSLAGGGAERVLVLMANEMAARGEQGSIVSLICDAGERYLDTLYDDAWYAAQGN